MKKLIVSVIVIAVAVGAGLYWKSTRGKANHEEAEIATAVVKRQTIVKSVSTTGHVVASQDVEIKCKASGQIVALPFDVSDVVSQGDLLVEIDPIDEERQVKRSETTLLASRARLAQARQNLRMAEKDLVVERKRADSSLKAAEARDKEMRAKAERIKRLLEKQHVSEELYETANTLAIQTAASLEAAQIRIEELDVEEMDLEVKRQAANLAEAQVKSDEIALEIARQRLDDTRVAAPIDGVVSERRVQVGQIISSGISNVGGGTTMLVVSDLARLYVLAAVDESDIGKVRLDQGAVITVDAFPEDRFRGKVVRIATKGENVSNVVTFEVKIEVTGRNKSLLKQEMTANVDIICARADDALTVPVNAVLRKEGKQVVTVIGNAEAGEEREVTVGVNDGVLTEITEGLAEGDTVVAYSSEAQSRWRSGGDEARRQARSRRLMMRMGGGGRRGR